jgi:DNA-binding transcriptional LysR family regulator
VVGDVHLGAVALLGKYLLPRIIGEFRASYPEANVSMLVGNSKEMLEYLQDDVIELAIVSEPIPASHLKTTAFYRDFLVAIVHPDHPWAHRKEIEREELFSQDFISREVGSGTREIYAKILGGRSKESKLRTVMVLGSTEAVRMAVMGKMGYSIVSQLAVQSEIEMGLLKAIPIRNLPMVRDFHVVCKSEKHLSVPALRLKEFLKAKKREFPSAERTPRASAAGRR